MRKITKKYLIAAAFAFLFLPILKASADDASLTNASTTPTQVVTTFNLNYTTDGNGTINGSSTQTINQGQSGTVVTAVPNSGFQFVNWSDNSTDNPRTDANVSSNINVTANFASSTSTTTPDQGSTSTASTTIQNVSTTTATSTVNVFVRYNDQILFNGQINLTTNSTDQFSVTDDSSTTRQISAQSALAILEKAATQSNTFNISDLQYYSSFNEYLINCIQINSGTSTNACYNWQYVVDGIYPQIGIDQEILKPGDTLDIYFGQPRKIIVPDESGTSSVPFTVSAVNYDYQNNLWNPLPNVVVGATQPDPNNPWSPIIISTSTTDNLGNANFDITATGTYNFGLEEDYYYPTYPFIIAENVGTTTSSSTEPVNNGGGGSSQTHQIPNLESMLSFLDINQKSDGSFGSDLYTDWAAVAYGTTSSHSNAKSKLKQFIKSESFNGEATTDYERRAMAMLALGLNPYTDGNQNYIKKITDSFDGNQIGNSSLFNDDIFGIITLLSSGYSSSDNIIQKSAQFIISRQSPNGEWDSVDLTGAAIQALSLVQSAPGATTAITKGLNFLKTAQVNDGGFNNPASTSWAIQGLIAGNSNPDQLINNGKNPFDYLSSVQIPDGSIGTTTDSLDNRIWNTSYAIPAGAGDTWSNILQSVSTPIVNAEGGISSNITLSTTTSTSTVSTTTIPLTTQESTTTSSTTAVKVISSTTHLKTPKSNLEATASTTKIQNANELAGVASSGFNFNTHNILMILGSVLAGIGVFSIIFI